MGAVVSESSMLVIIVLLPLAAFVAGLAVVRRRSTARLHAIAGEEARAKQAAFEAALEADRQAAIARQAEPADRCRQRMEDLLVYAAVTGAVSASEVEAELASAFAWIGLPGPAREAIARCPNPELARTPEELRAAVGLLASEVDAASRTRVLEGLRRLIGDGAGLEGSGGYRGASTTDGPALHELYASVFAATPAPPHRAEIYTAD
jgi:hypothetical protein